MQLKSVFTDTGTPDRRAAIAVRGLLVCSLTDDLRETIQLSVRDIQCNLQFISNENELFAALEGAQTRPVVVFDLASFAISDPLLDAIATAAAGAQVLLMPSAATAPLPENALVSEVIQHPASYANIRAALTRLLREGRNEPAVLVDTPEPFIKPTAWGKKISMLVDRIGPSNVPLLLTGETGVGKEVLARALHARSGRATKPFIKLNCAALPSELVESELFGYERGAFTGAFKTNPGKFELADGGTILLDEIGDMDLRLQSKLLQVLQDSEFLRLGGTQSVRVDIRVIAATHCDLESAIEAGKFREDLYYRLAVVSVSVPPLRDRREEIIPLAELFLRKHGGPGPTEISPALTRALLEYHWPGNIRELENMMRRYLVIGSAELIIDELVSLSSKRRTRSMNSLATAASCGNAGVISTVEPNDFRPADRDPETDTFRMLREAQARTETDAIIAALNASQWNRKQAAKMLKIDYKALLYKMKKLGIGAKPKPFGSRNFGPTA